MMTRKTQAGLKPLLPRCHYHGGRRCNVEIVSLAWLHEYNVWPVTNSCYWDHEAVARIKRIRLSIWAQYHGSLEGEDFKLESRVRVVAPGSAQIDEELTLTEYYSNIQRRARLDIHSINRPSGSTNVNLHGIVYFYRRRDDSKQYLRLDALPIIYSSECKLAEPQILTQDLFGRAASLNGHSIHEQWLEDRPDVPDYVVGLARLMLIVASNRDKLEPTNRPDVLIRNQKAKKYTLKDRMMSSGDKLTELIVYYANTEQHEAGVDLPLRIWLITPDFAEIIVDYSFGGPIWPRSTDPVNESNNFFSFPLGFGCSDQFPKATSVGTKPKQEADVFSFRFEKESPRDDEPISSYFVAYDGFAEAVRLDLVDQMDADERVERDYSITIANIKNNRRFNIRQQVRLGQSGETEIDTSSGGRQCVGSSFVPADPQSFLHDLTLPFDQMAEMGTKRVRGVEARAFEQVTSELPALFFPKLWYRNPGTYKYEYMDEAGSKVKWVVVYYFSPKSSDTTERDGQFGQLMRVDVIRMKMVEFRFEVFDFVWSLQMAPNGDSQDELFALRDRCSQTNSLKSSSADRYADLDMYLEYDPKENNQISAQLASEYLISPSTRRQELVRAFVLSNSLGATNVYDIESRLSQVDNGNKMLMMVDAKLIDTKEQPLFEAVFLSHGGIRQTSDRTSATNADECFWDALHRMREMTRPILFSYCFSVCVFDANAEFRIESKNY